MPDAIFGHPRLAPIYDAFDGGRGDLGAYLAIADELGARTVLDVGCGTGSLAMVLAASGRTVVGVDPAEASLRVAETKDPDGRVRWILGDATAAPALGADLATMTGNVAQVILTDDEWARTLRAIHGALRPGGNLVFESRRPERRAWEEWAAEPPQTRDISGVGEVERRLEVTRVSLPYVSFRYSYLFFTDESEVVSDSTLRFRDLGELTAGLEANGYRVRDVREAPDRPGREYVVVADTVE
jgi:SAM-dependent methyltransferase